MPVCFQIALDLRQRVARLHAYREAGVDTVVMTPVPGAMDAAIEQPCPRVMA